MYTLTTERDISAYLVEYLVGYKLLKLEEDQRLVYKDFDLTETYEDSYFRMFEDCEDEDWSVQVNRRRLY